MRRAETKTGKGLAGEAVSEEKTAKDGRSFGAFTERSPFTITLDGEVAINIQDSFVTLTLEIQYPGGTPITGKLRLPLSYFPSPELLAEFARDTKTVFTERLRDVLTSEAQLHMQDVAGYIIADMGIEPLNKNEIIAAHITETTDRLKKTLADIPDTPRRSAWTTLTLERVARGATLEVIQKGKKVTLENVADAIRRYYPATAPVSGEALRKMLDRFGVDWRMLKADTTRRAKSPVK
jgi:hypothetical protein